MPLYLVRWPNLSGALVRARNEAELVEILDELGDPGGCTWKEYRGPLFLDFELPVTLDLDRDGSGIDSKLPLTPDQVRIQAVEKLIGPDGAPEFPLSFHPGGETGSEMAVKMFEFWFPHYARLWERCLSEDRQQPVSVREIQNALMRDLQPLLRSSWRHAALQRKNDLRSQLMLRLDRTDKLPGDPLPDDDED